MINYLKGIVAEIGEGFVVVEVGGIGYEVAVSATTLRGIERMGEKVTLFTHMTVREDGIALMGFSTRPEKDMFLRLINVSGIGAKLAISVLSGISESELSAAIASGDIARICAVKGIGKKTAERIVLELKDKVCGDLFLDVIQPQNQDALLALTGMGFTRQEATALLGRVKNAASMTPEQLILAALKENR